MCMGRHESYTVLSCSYYVCRVMFCTFYVDTCQLASLYPEVDVTADGLITDAGFNLWCVLMSYGYNIAPNL